MNVPATSMASHSVRSFERFFCKSVLAAAVLILPAPFSGGGPEPLHTNDFEKVVTDGFGDRQNSIAWSMQWFEDALYVGTFRSAGCVGRAIQATYYPWISYPPDDPEMECAESPEQLPLQAEIWRWGPDTAVWDRVFVSPQDVPIPGHPGEFVARDIGFRDMAVFTESDGTRALYVAGFTARDLWPGIPPPRILRSTDGVRFEPVPQDAGTFLGDLDTVEGLLAGSFSRLAAHDGRFYAIVSGSYGHGVVIESARPESGNDSFRVVTEPGATATALASFADSFYVARGANPLPGVPGYDVLATDPGDSLPYTYATVVPEGAYRALNPSRSVVHMKEFEGSLWVGTRRPTELIRIHPDGSWDLLVGNPRETSDGTKYPLSGLGDNFDWAFNVHIHRMEAHEGLVYVATNDVANQFPWTLVPWMVDSFDSQWGFDLFRASDGFYFYPITDNGFELSSYNFTGRTLSSTPEGLFLGTGNHHHGLQVWRGRPSGSELEPPRRLELERQGRKAILSWDAVPYAATYQVRRSDFASEYRYATVGATAQTHYVDDSTGYLKHLYFVEAQAPDGRVSSPSNVVRSPSYFPAMKYSRLENELVGANVPAGWIDRVHEARTKTLFLQFDEALGILDQLRVDTAQEPTIPPWRAETLEMFIAKMMRRVGLARDGAVTLISLF